MNYREWLVYRARQHAESKTAVEPEILRYAAWRNYQALRDWNRRAFAEHPHYASIDKLTRRPTI